jgi:MIP family channel proteins
MHTDFVLWKALLVEFLGTFTLVFIGASAVALTVAQGGNLLVSALAFGLALMAVFYAWGNYSGTHLNPAVSFGFFVAGRMKFWLMLVYWVAQLLGGILAAALVAYFFGTASGVGASIGSLTSSNAWKAVLLEAILTFFLVITILLITRNPAMAVISGLVIGMVLTFDMLAGYALTGASMNPARSLGPALFSGNIGTYWIYVVGPLLGALVAALVYRVFETDWSATLKVDECGNPVLDACGNCVYEKCRDKVDNCGNPVMDDCGKHIKETIVVHHAKHGFIQETPMEAAGQWMTKHGMSPMYIRQQVQQVMPNGVVPPVVAQEASRSMRTVPLLPRTPNMSPLASQAF